MSFSTSVVRSKQLVDKQVKQVNIFEENILAIV
jgi:hypothetical protein